MPVAPKTTIFTATHLRKMSYARPRVAPVQVERWSTLQVETLAPDASSLNAAHGLSGAASWKATGRLDDILWGVYHRYQVCVDLSGPAYKCSCPSRKVPCKHALGLLMRWAESDVSDAEAPAFVHEWQAARA